MAGTSIRGSPVSTPEHPCASSGIDLPAGKRRAVTAGVVLLGLVGVLVVLLDWREVQVVLGHANWEWAPLALLSTGLSYLSGSYSFARVTRCFGVPMGQWDLTRVGLASSAMITAVGGMAGHSLRLLLMVRRGVKASDALAPSLFHGYLESLLFFALLPAGLVLLLVTHPLPGQAVVGIVLGTGVLGVAFVLAAVVFFEARVRGKALGLLRTLWRWTVRRDIGAALVAFDTSLRSGLRDIRQQPRALVTAIGLVIADRLIRLVVVWFCFQALGVEAGLPVVIVGLAIGVVLGVMSMVPGGLGVQEGSMAAAYHLLGVPLEEAVLVPLLFRLVYYTAPFALSLLLYRRLLSQDPRTS